MAPEAKSKKNLCLYKSNVIWLPLLTTLVTLDCLVNEQDIMPSVALAVGFPISLCAHIRGFSMPWDTFKNIFKIVYFQQREGHADLLYDAGLLHSGLLHGNVFSVT